MLMEMSLFSNRIPLMVSAHLSGMAIGTMLGALGGPVGLLVGMLGGTMTGALLDSDHFDFSEDFGAKVSSRLQPGTSGAHS